MLPKQKNKQMSIDGPEGPTSHHTEEEEEEVVPYICEQEPGKKIHVV